MRWVWIALAIFVVLWIANRPSHAHDWYSSTVDPVIKQKCCGGSDCAPVDPAWVSETKDGYHLVMTLEQARTVNPTAKFPIDAIIPWDRVQSPPKADHPFYACIWATNRKPEDGNGVICFFAVPTT